MLLIDSQRLFSETRTVLNEILTFLDLPHYEWNPDILSNRYNRGQYKEAIPSELERDMREFYRPHNERLFEILGQRYDWPD